MVPRLICGTGLLIRSAFAFFISKCPARSLEYLPIMSRWVPALRSILIIQLIGETGLWPTSTDIF